MKKAMMALVGSSRWTVKTELLPPMACSNARTPTPGRRKPIVTKMRRRWRSVRPHRLGGGDVVVFWRFAASAGALVFCNSLLELGSDSSVRNLAPGDRFYANSLCEAGVYGAARFGGGALANHSSNQSNVRTGVVTGVGGFPDGVAFVGIDDQLYGHVESFEGVPPLDRLFHGDFAVAVTDEDERWSFHGFYEVHGIAFGVDRGIVVDGCAEERNHPLVDVVEAVVAEPVGETSARHCRRETLRLCFGPHGHVAAVTVAANAEAMGIDRILLRQCRRRRP